MKSKFSLIIDFDSTIVGLETLECLAEVVLSKNKNKNKILNKISNYTDLAMNGQISFEKSLQERLKLMSVNKSVINVLINEVIQKIDKSFLSNLNFFKKHISNIYIVSGGFKSIIEPVMNITTDLKWKVYANDLIFNKDEKLIGVDLNNPLSKSKGKVKLLKSLDLKNDIIVVGDGYTDYEIKKYNIAKYFLAYTKYEERDKVTLKADKKCKNFNQVIEFLKENY